VNQQSTMMAYSDISWIFGIMFLATLPLLFLFSPRKAGPPAVEAAAH